MLSDAGRQYMEEDAYRWQTQQTNSDVIAPVPQLTNNGHTRPLLLPAYGDDSSSADADAESQEEEDEGEANDITPLPEFIPFSVTFAVSLSPAADHPSSLDTPIQSAYLTAGQTAAVGEAEEGREGSKKKRGMVAADLLSHFAQKEVVDEERERTRKRERSKWETNTPHSTHHGGSSTSAGADSGGVMVGGLGLSDESSAARQARLAVDAEEEERRRQLSAAAEEEGLTAADMPDMSDFIKLYEDEDEPSYPAIIWRQKERLTEAADVPLTVIAELQAIDGERVAAQAKRRGKSREREAVASREAAKRGHERKPTLRFNLGLGKDYEEEHEEEIDPAANKQHPANSSPKNRFPSLATAARLAEHNKAASSHRAPRNVYGRQWYLPVVRWSITEEEKERLEAVTAESAQQNVDVDGAAEAADTEADGYHGDGWRDKVLALKAELPHLYCSRAFKAFLLREREKEGGRGGGSRGGRRPLPHYLEGVEALDEKKEEEEEKRAIQAAVLAISTPRITHSSSTGSTVSTRTHSAASTSAASGLLRPPSLTAEDNNTSAKSGVVGEEEREGDLLEYMREVRMRELNLAGLRWIKEREKAMEEREKRKRDREKRKARAGGTAAAGSSSVGSGGSDEVGDVDDEVEVDLDELFDVPDYLC